MDVKKALACILAMALAAMLTGCSEAAAAAARELMAASVEHVVSENPDSPSVSSEADSLLELLDAAAEPEP